MLMRITLMLASQWDSPCTYMVYFLYDLSPGDTTPANIHDTPGSQLLFLKRVCKIMQG